MYCEKRFRGLMVLALTLVLAFGPQVRPKAAPEDGLGFLALYDSNGDAVNISVAFAEITDSAVYVYADGALDAETNDFETAVYISRQENGSYLAQFLNRYGAFSFWKLQDYVTDNSTFYPSGVPHRNDEATIYYMAIISDEEMQAMSESTVLTGYEEGVLEATSYPQGALYPAPVLNADGELVGILAEDGVIVASAGDEETFYGGSAPPEEQTSPEEPSEAPTERQTSPEEPSETPTERQTSPEEPSETPTERQTSPEEPSETPATEAPSEQAQTEIETERQTAAPIILPDPPDDRLWLYIAAAVFALAACIFIFAWTKKRREKEPPTAPSPMPPSPMPPSPMPPSPQPLPDSPGWEDDIGPTKPVSGNDIGPTRPVSGNETVFLIAAKDGYMKGRVYKMIASEHLEITIGRNPETMIRYPVDTAGISRIHARLFWRGNDLVLMDCNSTGGTFLRRTGKLTPMVPVVLEDGDIFCVGEKKNIFEVARSQ